MRPSALRALRTATRRRLFSSDLADTKIVDGWMADERLVDGGLGFLRRLELWAALRLLPGLDLPDFLEGTRFAYSAVTRLMYRRDFEGLAPLVLPACLTAMEEAMDEFGGAAHRVVDEEADDAISVRHAVLHRAFLLQPESGPDEPKRCHLDVRFSVSERFRILDMRTNEPVPPFDGRERVQESTWRFEGPVTAAEDESDGWRVHSIV